VLHLPIDRTLAAPLDDLSLVTRKPQAVKWDFPAVIGRYRENP